MEVYMHANLNEEEARVVIEKMDADPTKPFSSDDREHLQHAQKKLTEAMLSRSETHKAHLIRQGMTPERAAQHARHRFGEF